MTTTIATRRLAAILAADVVGYSRLMGVDEEGTHERLKAHLAELVDPKIREHHGRIVKTTGDGVLAEFASVVDAVRCAGEIQRAMADRDLDLAEERRLRFRIGVNLGDVIADGDDIYGDGVNIAARLEGWRRRTVSASRAPSATTSATGSLTPSRTWGNRASRTSHGRCGSMRCAPKASRLCRAPDCRRERRGMAEPSLARSPRQHSSSPA
jgi:class 3 adenylate cyclase